MQTLTQGRLLPLAAALVLTAAPASALSIEYSNGDPSDTFIVTDGGAGDDDGLAGSIDYDSGMTNPLGGWELLSTQASSCASAIDCPNLTLSFEANSLGEPADLRIAVTQTDLTLDEALFGFDTTLSGFTGGEATITSYYDPSNTAFGEAERIGESFSFAAPDGFSSFAMDGSDLAPGASPFSLTTVIEIAHALGDTQTYGDSKVAVASAVPVPAALPLLAGALGLSGLMLRRRGRA
ncbi:hypothetical protein [uncultured Albimonas sp.]|uniref:hypothetical protein n=1 Tax=uncultured Albimonas sp. TaxID=1331701 RepID=UPI0030ED981B|tara:strand:+ start:1942 stop:2652 length:711 start_codon:yes stop_codon:yes gene_type:complete